MPWAKQQPTYAYAQPLRYEKTSVDELVSVDTNKLGQIPEGGGHRKFGAAGWKIMVTVSKAKAMF